MYATICILLLYSILSLYSMVYHSMYYIVIVCMYIVYVDTYIVTYTYSIY